MYAISVWKTKDSYTIFWTSVQSPHNAHCTHLQKTHASPSTKTKNNPKSSSFQPVQKINNNQQATSSTPSTPKTHASLSAKTENNPKSSSVTSSPINNAKKTKILDYLHRKKLILLNPIVSLKRNIMKYIFHLKSMNRLCLQK